MNPTGKLVQFRRLPQIIPHRIGGLWLGDIAIVVGQLDITAWKFHRHMLAGIRLEIVPEMTYLMSTFGGCRWLV